MLKEARSVLMRSQKMYPGADRTTFAFQARFFNSALDMLDEELTHERLRPYYYGRERIIPKGRRKGIHPRADGVNRDQLITDIDEILMMLGEPDLLDVSAHDEA